MQDVVISGEVTCLVVLGNVARVGGIITSVRGGLLPATVNVFLITATDSGKFSNTPDTGGVVFLAFNPVTFTPGAPCAFQAGQIPVTDGEIVIYDSLG
jgi:hypothetical protein